MLNPPYANVAGSILTALLLGVGHLVLLAAPPSDPAGLANRFANPPADCRILKIIHPWPDAPEAQDQLRQSLTNQGFGGVVCNVSFDHYLESEPKWRAFTRAVTQARQNGMALWLYDERGYPSGNAGGLVLRDHPEWQAHGLLIADTEVEATHVTLRLPPGTPVLVAAFPTREHRLDLAGKAELKDQVRDGVLHWTPPPGSWRVLAITEGPIYEGTHAAMNLAEKMPYVNLLQAEPTARFLELTHDRYAQHLGHDLGRYFMATFTDEPSLMSLFLRPMPYRVLPWATSLPAEFQRRRGYAIDGILPALVADTGPRGQRERFDYWQTIGELVSDNYFGQIQNWCHEHNTLSGGHLLMEEGLAAHVPLYGDFFRCARRLDAPSIDCLTSVPPEVPWFIARLLSSAAELEGRSVVMSETSDHSQQYRPAGDKRPVRVVTEAEIRGTANRQMVSGVNLFTSYYTFRDLDTAQLRRLNEWVGRCCAMLRGGHQVADVAVLYPVESLWARFTPARHWATDSPGVARLEALYRATADSLFYAQRDFTFVDSRALRAAKVKDHSLVHGKMNWRVLVLPGADTLPWTAWEKLATFVRAGGVVIAVGATPLNSETEFPSPRVTALAQTLFGDTHGSFHRQNHPGGGAGIYLPVGSEGLLPTVLNEVLAPDFHVSEKRSPLRVTHRQIEAHEVYFVINDSAKPWSGQVTFSVAGRGEQWDPNSGQVSPLEQPSSPIEMTLAPYDARLFRFDKARLPKRYAGSKTALAGYATRTLPEMKPVVQRGEFVREELRLDPIRAKSSNQVWQVVARLTKSQVDTFLFTSWLYPGTVDFSEADGLVIDTWAPEGQRCVAQILVVVRDQDGGDFLASTGRSLASPGYGRAFLPLTRFQLAGWSKDADGLPDWGHIKEVRVGWGGYLGDADEKVEFSCGTPELQFPPGLDFGIPSGGRH